MFANLDDMKRTALESIKTIANDLKIPLKIGNIDKLAYAMIKIIDRAKDDDDRENKTLNVTYFLAFYLSDECIKKTGGDWVDSEESAPNEVSLPNGTKIYPIDKVTKFLENGEADSLYAYYKVATMLG